jgi:NDP-sugar pyrophosphorylase family protein
MGQSDNKVRPVIVVLAAGMGSRYGGLKQMDRIGKNGEVLLDYSIFDAKRAGFGKAVFIIRRDIEKDFNETVLSRIGGNFPCETAFQEMDKLIPADVFAAAQRAGRTKPWGTAHALLCAADNIDAPFTVINADDFYGKEAFETMGNFLSAPEPGEGAIVPYMLEKTLSPQGTVTRGVCSVRDGYLASVDELTAIAREGDGKIYNTAGGSRQELADTVPVSMNFWGFPPSVFPCLERYFGDFLDSSGALPKSECYLPMAADWFIKNDLLKIRVLEADSPWFGVTYREDREAAVQKIGEFTARGIYPPSLW